MVFHNSVAQDISAADYGNEMFRARHGYKEAHVHDAPYRRNRDFKPANYGSFKGFLNYRHSEPYCLLKNMKDLAREEHHHPIKWTKQFLKGALTGGLLGYTYFVGSNAGPQEMSKLMAAVGSRGYSGRVFRLLRATMLPYAVMGGTVALSYTLIIDFMTHHDESNNKPAYINHAIATTLLSGVFGVFNFTHPYHIFASGFFGFMMVSPISWWFMKAARQ